MTKKAVVFGAGNIGRGFIGQLFSESGYEVTFIDVDQELIDAFNRDGSYRLETVYNSDIKKYRVGPIRGVHGGNVAAVREAVAEAEIGATAVGAGALKFIAPNIAAGIEQRAAAGTGSLNLIICENLKGAAAVMRDMVRERLNPACHAYMEANVGFVDTVIGRMVPMPTAEMRAADVSMIRVEPYKELPVDQAAFVDAIPDVTAMMPQASFPIFTARKLYIHNCGHALLAYTGYLRGHEYGYQALKDPVVRKVMAGGLHESITGIVAKYGADLDWLIAHRDDLMHRFANQALGDTIFRLGRDPLRKLKPGDRLAGPAELACATGQNPRFLAWGIAAALLFDPAEDKSAQELQQQIQTAGLPETLKQVVGIDPQTQFGKTVMQTYETLATDHLAQPDV